MKQAEEAKKHIRYFDTESGTSHNSQDMTANVVGSQLLEEKL